MAMLLLHENATVEITHSKTVELKEVTKSADILVATAAQRILQRFAAGQIFLLQR